MAAAAGAPTPLQRMEAYTSLLETLERGRAAAEARPPPGGALQTILAAQEGGARTPPYAAALGEIRAGRKKTHWVWYVWPTLKSLRPGTHKPQYLLPDFATAVQYLATPPLAGRLREISQAACEQLRGGVAPETLMGSATDAGKLHESWTLFALAAAAAGEPGQLALFCGWLEALRAALSGGGGSPSGGRPPELFDARTVAAVRGDGTTPPQLRRQLSAPQRLCALGH